MYLDDDFKDKSIIVVGNSPSLLSQKKGNEIDKFDIVIRFNRFETENLEEYTGIKTDIWVLNFKTLRLIEHGFENKAKKMLVQGTFENFDKEIKEYAKHLSKIQKIPNCFLVEKNQLSVAKTKNQTDYILTSGLNTIIILLEICKVSKLYITGFDFLKDKNNLHYYERYKRNDLKGKKRKHDSSLEESIVNSYVHDNRIIFL